MLPCGDTSAINCLTVSLARRQLAIGFVISALKSPRKAQERANGCCEIYFKYVLA